MQAKTKRTLRLSLLLVVALALLIGAYVLISHLRNKVTPPAEEEPLRYEPIAGEDTSANRLYPPIYYEGKQQNATDLKIKIKGEDGTYGVLKEKDDATFYFFTENGEGKEEIYLPPISTLDKNFNYSSLYSIEDMGMGIGLPRVMYLVLAASNLYFTERIPLNEDAALQQTQLKNYGLHESKNTVTFFYIGTDGQAVEHRLTIGHTTVNKTGYYLLVDDRPYVYVSSTDSVGYLLEPFSYYVSPTLISPGTTGNENSQYEGFLAVLFREFVNRVCTEGTVSDGSIVLLEGAYREKETAAFGPVQTLEFDLSMLMDDEQYGRLAKALRGSPVGAVDLKYTIPNEASADRQVLFDTAAARTYTYTVLSVEAVLSDTERTYGTVGAEAELLKLRYSVSKDGAAAEEYSGVLALSDALLTDAVRAQLRALPVGRTLTASEQVTFSVTYTESIGAAQSVTLVIDDILIISDKNGAPQEKVTADSIVYCRYHYVLSGEPTATIFGTFDLGQEGEAMDELRSALVGRPLGTNLNLTAYTQTEVFEILYGYSEYRLDKIVSFVEQEQIVAFGYEDFRDRDPFYRETYFSNKLPAGNKYRQYGLNDLACQNALRILGGIQSDSSVAAGMFGTETVAIGLSPQVLYEYDLYENRLFIEWPRDIGTWRENEDEQLEFDWGYTLPFTLYVSDVKYDRETGAGFRFVASDLYDIVVRVEEERLSFLEYSFNEYWARETMYSVDLFDVESIKVTTNLDNFAGEFLISAETRNVTNSDGSTYQWLRFGVTPSAGFTCATLQDYMTRHSVAPGEKIYFNSLYDDALGQSGSAYGKHYAGDGNFRVLYEKLLRASFEGTLTEQEQADYAAGPMLLSLSFKLTNKATWYTYEFYRGSDRRVMVRLYQEDASGTQITESVQDFYVSTRNFKLFANGLQNLFSGVMVDPEQTP